MSDEWTPDEIAAYCEADAASDALVAVPRELLREVLEAAEEDSRHSQLCAGTWANSFANASMYEEDRDRIAKLRRIAGLEESDGGKR